MTIYEHNLQHRYAILGEVETKKLYTISFNANGKMNFRIDIINSNYEIVSTAVPLVNGVATRYQYTIRPRATGVLALYVGTEAGTDPASWTKITNLTMEAQQ